MGLACMGAGPTCAGAVPLRRSCDSQCSGLYLGYLLRVVMLHRTNGVRQSRCWAMGSVLVGKTLSSGWYFY